MGAKITFLAAGAKTDAASVKPILTVPAAAVATRDGRPVVYQINDDRAVEIPVTTGQKLAGLIEITSGLKEGDKVIGKVDDKLRSGSKVTQKTK
jgi:hypothetical protein